MLSLRAVPFASQEYNACKQLRHDVLRVPLGLALSEQDVAGEETQIHIAAFDDALLCGLIILKPLGKRRVKFRQMAVAPSHQGRGLGNAVMKFAENYALAQYWTDVELHARVYAKGFYEKLGYRTVGEEFIEVTIPTVKMVKGLG